MYTVTLENLRGGAALEMVNNALQEVWENALDPNTDPQAKRSVVLKLEFKPAQDRASSPITIKVEKKLAPQAPVAAHVNIGTDQDGLPTASEYQNPNQMELPIDGKSAGAGEGTPVAENVTPFKSAAHQ